MLYVLKAFSARLLVLSVLRCIVYSNFYQGLTYYPSGTLIE